jgi:DNA primase
VRTDRLAYCFAHQRFGLRSFLPGTPDHIVPGTELVLRSLHGLDKLRRDLEAEATEVRGDVWWLEGEKDVDAARRLGLTATTSGSATAALPPDVATQLRYAARLFIVPDNDKSGREGAQRVAQTLANYFPDVRIVELPVSPEHGDLSDYLAQGHSRADLEQLAEKACNWHTG